MWSEFLEFVSEVDPMPIRPYRWSNCPAISCQANSSPLDELECWASMRVTLEGRTKSCWKVLATKHILERGVWARSPWGRLLAGKTCAEDTTTLTGTGFNKLCENERHNCTLFTLFTREVDILVTGSMPLAFAQWRGRGLRGVSMWHWVPKGAVDTRMLSYTLLTAVMVPTLMVRPGTGAIIQGSEESGWRGNRSWRQWWSGRRLELLLLW